MRPQAVFFDLGNVLARFDWRRSLRRLGERVPALDSDAFVDWLLGAEGPHDPYCRGEIGDTQLLAALRSHLAPDEAVDEAWLVHLWNDMFTPIPESLELADALAGQVHRGLLSNTNRLHFEHLDARLRLRARFDSVTLSHEVGALKPDPAIYRAALATAGVPPSAAVFTDDIPGHVDGARALGMDGHVFLGVDGLRRYLRGRGFSLPH